MVVDTSAVTAILFGEPEAERLSRALLLDDRRLMSAFSALECAIVVEARKGASGAREWEVLARVSGIELVPLTAAQYLLATEAWRRFGKGRHPASLNIGDCCSYALAAESGEPLLFMGDDFPKTDLPTVAW